MQPKFKYCVCHHHEQFKEMIKIICKKFEEHPPNGECKCRCYVCAEGLCGKPLPTSIEWWMEDILCNKDTTFVNCGDGEQKFYAENCLKGECNTCGLEGIFSYICCPQLLKHPDEEVQWRNYKTVSDHYISKPFIST